jgi:PrgI family protein
MSTYKVIQDIEAEDKILGPLTLRQFIYALITALFGYICFIALTHGAAFLLAIFLPPALFTGFFAFPFGRDQPTEVWAVHKIRFLFKPRRRIWDQSGIRELVTITVPKREIPILTNGLSQSEVQSRLQVLAKTIDSRGWATKNVNVNLSSPNGLVGSGSSDRLIDTNTMPQEVPGDDIQASDDMLDEVNNPIARQFDTMIDAAEQSHRQRLMNELNQPDPSPASPGQMPAAAATQPPALDPGDYWFLNQPAPPASLAADQTMFDGAQVVRPGSSDNSVPAGTATDDEAALAAEIKARNASSKQLYHSHLRTIQPLGSQPQPVDDTQNDTQATVDDQDQTNQAQTQTDSPQPAPAATDTPATASSATPYDPAILSLANNNDLNVATLAREAQKAKEESQDEVVISLH